MERQQTRPDDLEKLSIRILPFLLTQATLHNCTTLVGKPPGRFICAGLLALS